MATYLTFLFFEKYSLAYSSYIVLVCPYQFPLFFYLSGSDQQSSLKTSGSGLGATADIDEVKTKTFKFLHFSLDLIIFLRPFIPGLNISSSPFLDPIFTGVAVEKITSQP